MKSIRLLMMTIAAIISFASFAQDKAGKKDTTKHYTLVYSCPMHPEIASDKPGKCSKCGMNLTLSKKETMKAEVTGTYTCPMHPTVTSDKPGKCAECGMSLTLSKKEQMKAEVVNGYYCPMHSDVTGDKPGKCSKCGMALVKKKN